MSAARRLRSLRTGFLAALAVAILVVQIVVPWPDTTPAARADTDPIPGLVGAQTVTRTTPNTSSSVGDADLIGNGDALVSTFGGPDALGFDVSKTNFWKDGTSDGANAMPMRLGQVIVKIPSLAGGSYAQQQDMYNAEIRSSFATSGVSIVERSRVLASSGTLLATDITNSSSAAVSVTVDTAANTAWTSTGASTTAGVSGDTAWVSKTGPTGLGDGPGGIKFVMRAALSTRIIGATATVTTNSTTTSTSAFSVPAGATVTVVTQIASTGGDTLTTTPSDPVAGANTAVQAVTATSLASLGADHASWWSTFWHASSVNLTAEPTLMRYYYGALYVLASSNRAGNFAPGLFGWNGTDTPNWQGDYTTNYNVQSPYYGVYSANHPELAASYYKSINSISTADGLSYAASRGFSGTYFRTHYGPLGIRTEARGNQDWGQRTNALESAINYLKDYSYTLDTTRLQNTSYPFLIEVANFWDAYLVKDASGRYVVNSSNVAEDDSAHKFNPTTALAYLRTFYAGMLTASTDLGVDASRRAKWQDILTNLAAYPTITYAGKTVFSFSEDNPSAEANPYPYNLYAVHPADQVGESSPLAAVARNTIATRSYWTQGNSFAQIFVAAAKVGYPATEIVSQMNGVLAGMGPNNFYLQYGGGLETTGAIEAINSMLLSSTDGAIRVFPNWTGTDASFTSLRAVGAFTVSSSLGGGVVQTVSITSEKARTAVVRNPWPGKDLVVTKVGAGAVSTTRSGGNNYTFATTAGSQYVLSPAGGLPSAAPASLSIYKDATGSTSVTTANWNTAAVVDGDPRSVPGSLGWSSSGSTGSNHSESLTIDLRGSKLISKVDLTPRNDSGQVGSGFPVDMTIAVSADGSTWSTVSTASSIAQPTTASPISYSFSPQQAQFVRITGTSLRANPSDGNQYRMQFAEVSAFAAPTLAATASASSSVEAGGWGVAKVVNGTTTSAGSDLGWTSSSNSYSNHTESLTLDLGSAQGVGSVWLYPRSDGSNAGQGFPVDYTVATSTDGTSWTTVYTKTGQTLPASVVPVSFTPALVRYVKVTGTNLRPNPNDGNQYRMQYAEVTVFAGDPPVTATASSSVENSNWGVAKLVNGTTTSTAGDMGWSTSANTTANHTESATVDLALAKNVTAVTLSPRNDSGNVGQGFPVDYTVAVSTDGSTWTTVASRSGQVLPSTAQTLTFTSVSARYIKITGTSLRANPNDNNQYRMQFAEISVTAG